MLGGDRIKDLMRMDGDCSGSTRTSHFPHTICWSIIYVIYVMYVFIQIFFTVKFLTLNKKIISLLKKETH